MSIIPKLVCLSLPLVMALSAVAAEDHHRERTISVTGEGEATSAPDMATITTGVVTQAKEADEALEANNRAMERVIATLKSYQIAAKDIQTTSVDISPQRERGQRGQQSPEIVAYQVTNQVQVHVRNLPKLGEVLDALVESGSNQLSNIRFGLDDPTGVLNQARNRAVSDARAKAELYAQAAGVRVGKVLSISELSVGIPRPQMGGRMMAMAAERTSVPVETGEQSYHATIAMEFALEDRD